MLFLAALWLPILLSAVFVFIASSIMHMVLPYHKSDCRKLPDEDKLMATLRDAGLQRGHVYVSLLRSQRHEISRHAGKYKQGPIGMMTVFPPGPPRSAKVSGHVVCVLRDHRYRCCVCHRARAPSGGGTTASLFWAVFQVAGTAAFLAYGLANLSNGIWKGQPWSMTIKEVVDAWFTPCWLLAPSVGFGLAGNLPGNSLSSKAPILQAT